MIVPLGGVHEIFGGLDERVLNLEEEGASPELVVIIAVVISADGAGGII